MPQICFYFSFFFFLDCFSKPLPVSPLFTLLFALLQKLPEYHICSCRGCLLQQLKYQVQKLNSVGFTISLQRRSSIIETAKKTLAYKMNFKKNLSCLYSDAKQPYLFSFEQLSFIQSFRQFYLQQVSLFPKQIIHSICHVCVYFFHFPLTISELVTASLLPLYCNHTLAGHLSVNISGSLT